MGSSSPPAPPGSAAAQTWPNDSPSAAAVYRALLDSMAEGVSLSTADGVIVYTNPAEDRLFGYAAGELIGKHVSVQNAYDEAINREIVAGVMAELRRSGSWRGEWRNRRKDGSEFTSRARITAVQIEGQEHWLCVQEDISAEKAEQAELRDREAYFRSLADRAPVMMWVTAPDGRCTYLNAAWYAFTGQEPAAALDFGWLDATHPDDKARAQQAFVEANTRQASFQVEYRLRAADGSYRWALDLARPYRGGSGEFLGFVGAVIDIHERREAEERVRESEERLRTLTNVMPAIVWFATPDGELHAFNDRWYEYTGQTPDEALPNGWTAVVHPEDGPRVARQWEAARQAGVSYEIECRYRRRDGEYRWYLARAEPVRGADGAITAWMGTSSDIHDLKLAEAELAHARDRLQLATQAHRIGIFDWYVQTGEVVWSPEEEAIFGLQPGQFEGDISGWASRVLPEDAERMNAEMAGAMAERRDQHAFGFRIRRADGELRHIEGAARFLYRPDGLCERMVGTNVDVTDKVMAQDHQALLINELNHRVKNTLATVQALASQTAASAATPAEFQTAFEGRLVGLSAAHNLLTASNWEGAQLADVAAKALEPWDDGQGRVRAAGPRVWLSPRQALSLSMAFHELATNASKYGSLAGPGGRVELEWERQEDELRLHWRECDGPPVAPPQKRGFGARLLERGLGRELGGRVTLSFPPEGVRCEILAPLEGAPGPLPIGEGI